MYVFTAYIYCVLFIMPLLRIYILYELCTCMRVDTWHMSPGRYVKCMNNQFENFFNAVIVIVGTGNCTRIFSLHCLICFTLAPSHERIHRRAHTCMICFVHNHACAIVLGLNLNAIYSILYNLFIYSFVIFFVSILFQFFTVLFNRKYVNCVSPLALPCNYFVFHTHVLYVFILGFNFIFTLFGLNTCSYVITVL